MECKHENTRKLFWLDQNRGKWMTTNFSICQDCNSCVGMQPIETIEMKKEKTIKEGTHDALSDDLISEENDQ